LAVGLALMNDTIEHQSLAHLTFLLLLMLLMRLRLIADGDARECKEN